MRNIDKVVIVSGSRGLQKTDKWGAGGDNVDYDTGQVTTPGLATLLLTSPQKYRNTHET